MKKMRGIVACSLVLCFLAACGDTNRGAPDQGTSQGNNDKSAEGKTAFQEQSLKETQIQVGETVISLNEDMAEVQAALGESLDYSQTKSCLYDGYDKVYTYDQIIITTYPKENRDYVGGMEIFWRNRKGLSGHNHLIRVELFNIRRRLELMQVS